MPLLSCEGCVKDLFVSETELIERFTGKQLFLWGSAGSGALGDNTVVNKSSPVQTFSGGTNWRSVDAGESTVAAIKTDGSLWLWGTGSFGVLGNGLAGATASRSSPVQTISGGTNWKSVSISGATSLGIKTDGTLWAWGCGTFGRLGNGAVTDRSTPVQEATLGTTWKSVSAAYTSAAAIKTNGTLWGWGFNYTGNLGINNRVDRSTPVQEITAGTNWKQVSVANYVTAAIKTDGSLWTWGYGTSGQLGTNNIVSRSTPSQTVSSGTNWKQVEVAERSMAAIKTNGELWVWGLNSSGQLGTNDTVDRSSPVQTIAGGNNWRSVAVSARYPVNTTRAMGAIKTDGTLWMWGSGGVGGLGDNSTISRSSPVQTISGGTGWRQISMDGRTTAALFNEE